MSEKAIRKARSFIVRVGGDGLAPGADRLDRMGVVYERIAMAGTVSRRGSRCRRTFVGAAVVTAGVSYGEAELVDAGRALVAPAFFSRLAVGSRLIGAQAVAATFRPRPRGWTLVLLAVVALALMGVALWSTPGAIPLHPRYFILRLADALRRRSPMINFRYHVVSIIGIFIALAVGVVLGPAAAEPYPGGRQLVDDHLGSGFAAERSSRCRGCRPQGSRFLDTGRFVELRQGCSCCAARRI